MLIGEMSIARQDMYDDSDSSDSLSAVSRDCTANSGSVADCALMPDGKSVRALVPDTALESVAVEAAVVATGLPRLGSLPLTDCFSAVSAACCASSASLVCCSLR